jgi:hypothetical protein
MVLSGIFIEEVLPQGKKWSLEEGDVIVKRVEPIYGFPMDGYRDLWTGPSGEKYEQSVKRAMKGFIDHEKGRIRSDNLLIRGSELVRLGDEEE